MASRNIRLKGLKGNYQATYTEGDVVFRKYQKEWHIYAEYTNPHGAKKRMLRLGNDDVYVKANLELLEALKRICKPLTKINDKADNPRVGLNAITLTINDKHYIVGHKIAGDMATKPTVHMTKEQRKEAYGAIPTFGTFLANLFHLNK